MEITQDSKLHWNTDEILDYISDKDYKDEVLKQLRLHDTKGIMVTHISKTYELTNSPMYVLILKNEDGGLEAAVANKDNILHLIGMLVREGILSDNQYNILVEQIELL